MKKYIFIALLFFLSTSDALAYTRIPATITQNPDSTYNIQVDTTSYIQDSQNNEAFTTIQEYDLVNSLTHCNPKSGGSGSFGAVFNYTLDTTVTHINGVNTNSADCSDSGIYYITYFAYEFDGTVPEPICDGTSSNLNAQCYFVAYEYNSQTQEVTNPDYVPFPDYVPQFALDTGLFQTRFTNISFPPKQPPEQISVEYYLHPDEIDVNNSSFNPALIRFCHSEIPTGQILCSSYPIDTSITGTSTFTRSFDGTFQNNRSYDLRVDFYNSSALFGAPEPFDSTSITTSFEVISDELFPITNIQIDNNLTEDELICSLSSLSDCFKVTLIEFFYPSPDSMDAISSRYEAFKEIAPFSFLFSFATALNNLESQSGVLPNISVPEWGDFPEVVIMNESFFTSDPWDMVFDVIRASTTIFIIATTLIVLFRKTKFYISRLT